MRGRAIPEPRLLPFIRVALELEAGLLDSGVQGLFGTEELAEKELTNNPQLQ